MPQLLHDRPGDNTDTDPTAVAPAPDGATRVIVEAATAEEALEAVHREHGSAARILQAEKVLRGGIGGFFAKELVQLTVEPVSELDALDLSADTAPGSASDNAMVQALAQAAADEDAPEGETFGQMLDRRAAAKRDATPVVRSVRGSVLGEASPVRATMAGTHDSRDGRDLREMAMPTRSPSASTSDSAMPGGQDAPRGLAGVVADLAAATDHRESTFGDALRAAMVPGDDGFETAGGGGTATLVRGAVGTGATALTAAAAMVDTTAPATDHSSQMGAEERLDAAIRAVHAGTTAAKVVRAADAGTITGMEAPELGVEPATDATLTPEVARGAAEGRARINELIERTAAAVAATEAEQAAAMTSVATPVTPTPAAAPIAPAAAVHEAAPAPAPASAPTPALTVDAGPWSEDALRRLGLPDSVIRAIAVQRPADDLSWFAAVTRALQPLCGAMPEGSDLIVGGHARKFAAASETKVVSLDEHTPRRGSVALNGRLSDRARNWMDRELRNRWLHVVIGGAAWRDWLFEHPKVISWLGASDLPQAIAAAAQLDLTLGYGIVDGAPVRASAVDLTIALRGLLEAR